MQLDELLETDLFNQMSDQEQEVVAAGQDSNTIASIAAKDGRNYNQFVTDVFTWLANQPDGLYNHFDYSGFFGSLQKNGYLDSSSPGGSKATVPGSTNWRG